jgi:hypothetical protein
MQEQIRLALGSDPRCVLWRNSSGAYEEMGLKRRELLGLLTTLQRGNITPVIATLAEILERPAYWIRYGVGKGGSDLLGMNNRGRFLALEVKDGTDRLRPDQKLFLELVNNMGGYAAEVRNVADALKALELSFL